MIKFLTLASTLLLATASFAAPPFFHPALVDPRLPEGADVALLVLNEKTGETLYSHRAEMIQQPASLQKLITALASRLYLPTDFRFETTVETNQKDVILRFSGDPTFTRTDLRVLVERLKTQQNIIEGNLYLNGAAFDRSERAVGVPWDIMGVCYSAPSSSITLNGNCVYGKLDAAHEGLPVKAVKASAPQQVTIQATDIVLREGLPQPAFGCALKLDANDSNYYAVKGCVETHRLPVNFHLAIQNTTDFMQKVLEEELTRAGIQLIGQIIRNDQKTGTVKQRHYSDSLMTLIDKMVKQSDNLIADNLMKTLGRVYFDQPGSFESGEGAIKAVLKSKANIDIDSAVMVDGSGLSRNNRMSAEQLMKVVQYIFNNPDLDLVNTIPVSGHSGTLRGRPSVAQAPLMGRVTAKTGAIYGTYNLAGRLHARSGQPLLFVQIVSYYHPNSQRNSRQPLRSFERRLYESLYNDH